MLKKKLVKFELDQSMDEKVYLLRLSSFPSNADQILVTPSRFKFFFVLNTSLWEHLLKRVLKAHEILPLLPDSHVKRHDLLNASSMPM